MNFIPFIIIWAMLEKLCHFLFFSLLKYDNLIYAHWPHWQNSHYVCLGIFITFHFWKDKKTRITVLGLFKKTKLFGKWCFSPWYVFLTDFGLEQRVCIVHEEVFINKYLVNLFCISFLSLLTCNMWCLMCDMWRSRYDLALNILSLWVKWRTNEIFIWEV